MSTRSLRRWDRSGLVQAAILLALYYVFARWGVEGVALRYAPVSLIWPASGVGLALMLQFGTRPWPLLFAVAAAASWPSVVATPGGTPASDLLSAILIGAAGTLEPMLAVWSLHRFAGGALLERAVPFLVGVLALLPLSAALATVPLVGGTLLGGLTTVNHWAGLATTWYSMAIADVIGMIVLAPPIRLWLRHPHAALTRRQVLELTGFVALAAAALAIDNPVEPLYLLFIAHLGIAIRLPLRFATLAVTVSAIILLWRAATEIRAIQPPSVYEAFLTELTFMLTLVLITYVTALLWAEVSHHRAQLEQQVATRTQALEEANDRLEHLSSVDRLTGAWNRRYFEEHAGRELRRLAHAGSSAGLVALDLDYFKPVNDEYGHATGDAVLEQLVARLNHLLRPADVLARTGGDEFLIFLPDCRRAFAREIAERFCAAVSAVPLVARGVSISLTATLGVAVIQPADEDYERLSDELLRTLIREADANLIEAKRLGRNTVVGP